MEAKLRGYRGPFYPEKTGVINDLFNQLEINFITPNLVTLEEVGKAIPGFTDFQVEPKTSDGYVWAAALTIVELSLTNGRAAALKVLFPFLSDTRGQGGGVFLDRAIAFYTRGYPSRLMISVTMDKLVSEFERIFRICEARKI